jgi:hypothetical protein
MVRNIGVTGTAFRYLRCCEQCKSVAELLFGDTETQNVTKGISFTNGDGVGHRILPILTLPNTKIYDGLELDCDCNLMLSNIDMPLNTYNYEYLNSSTIVDSSNFTIVETPCDKRLEAPIDKLWSCGYHTETVESLEYCEMMKTNASTVQIGTKLTLFSLIMVRYCFIGLFGCGTQ